MENATKALLIAAAVLIVILLIAFGMRIFNSTTDVGSRAEASAASTSVQAFNSQFTGYEGRISGTAVRNLMTAVTLSNSKNTNKKITGEGLITGNSTNWQNVNAISPEKMYQVKITGMDSEGYINKISITLIG